jgi:hypothetical protein
MQVSHIGPKGIELHVVSILIFKILLCVSISQFSNHLLARVIFYYIDFKVTDF